jgi:hypothetical protein
MNPQNEKEVLDYLKGFKTKRGLYIIRPKDKQLLIDICKKLNFNHTGNIAYIGKAEKTKTSDLYSRAKQEMGWMNFEGATFVRKMGLYLDFDIKNKTNKELRDKTKAFICNNFTVECIEIDQNLTLLNEETKNIAEHKPCLNVKKQGK